jgi:dolichol-phosphate mannosyltransferase
MSDPVLSVIIPVYNEAATIAAVLDAVSAVPYPKQVVVVDDGSTDGTDEVLRNWVSDGSAIVEVVGHPANRGKGAAIRTALERCLGEVTVMQDADLEYDPADYPALIEPILRGEADAVYGSRYLRPSRHLPWTANRLCVVGLNLAVRVLYGQSLSDEATCYKAFRTAVLRRMNLQCRRFEFCPEVTAKACRMGLAIREVSIRYAPRTRADGKKIRWWDGIEAIATLIRWRLVRLQLSVADHGDTVLGRRPSVVPRSSGAAG